MRKIVAGIDMGSQTTRVVICGINNNSIPKVLASVQGKTVGMRHGYITEHAEATKVLRKLFTQAQRIAKVKPTELYVAIGGVSLSAHRVRTSIRISKKNSEISLLDTEQILEKAEDMLLNKIPNTPCQSNIKLMTNISWEIILE